MPSAIQLDPALLAAGAWLWTGTAWVKCSGDSTGRLRVNLAGSEITLNTYTYPTAGSHNVAVQNFPGNQSVTPYPNNWSNTTYTGSGLVKAGSTYLHWVVMTNYAGAARYCDLKNGTGGAAPNLMTIEVPAYDTRCIPFFPACYFSAGLYLVFQAADFRVTVGYY